jgi:phosphatidylglycerophosphate synthase
MERAARQLAKAGAVEIFVVCGANEEALREAQRLNSLKLKSKTTGVESLNDEPFASLPSNEEFLVLHASLVVDDRLVPEIAKRPAGSVAAFAAEDMNFKAAQIMPVFDAGGSLMYFGGAAKLYKNDVRGFATEFADDSDSRRTKSPIDAPQSCKLTFVDVGKLPSYSYDLRRLQPYLFMAITSAGDNPSAKKALLDAAQKSVLDWPAWYIHRPIEKWIIYRLCEYSITPNQLTVVNNVAAFAAAYFFAVGAIVPAMLLALSVGVLDGLDGKQARVKVMTSEIGRIEEVFDKIYENAWYLAIAYYLVKAGFAVEPYALFGLIFFLNMLDVAIGLFYKRKRGVQLDDAGEFERKFRVISGRRNTYIWTLLPFAAATALTGSAAYMRAGFAVVAGYAALTVGVRLARLFFRLSLRSPQGGKERAR